MLVPPPPPTYTLAPDVRPLGPGEQAALENTLRALTGRVTGVIVTAAGTTLSHHVLELSTPAGSLLVLERVATPAEAAVR
ncbi:hypothetical protein [Miltoncostaea marina]|uniref:hypothetical protein n=1 Tax=Miltoncostaea marina TaxID=2843215 RepID=UPI001C3D4E5E|nr:hypothetical protein [Miltoncostaea marina]